MKITKKRLLEIINEEVERDIREAKPIEEEKDDIQEDLEEQSQINVEELAQIYEQDPEQAAQKLYEFGKMDYETFRKALGVLGFKGKEKQEQPNQEQIEEEIK